MAYPVQSHELWTYLSRFVSPQTQVRDDGTMTYKGKAYVLSPSPTPKGAKPFIFRFYTYYFPLEGKFAFDLEGLRGALGPFRESSLGPKPPRDGSLVYKVLSLFYGRFMATPLKEQDSLPPVPHGDILTAIWSEKSPIIPSLWYMSTELPVGYLVAQSFQGTLCLASVKLSVDGPGEIKTVFDPDEG